MAKWIWYRGEFEAYHNLLLHSRRESYGYARPPFWDVPMPYPFVEFTKKFTAEKDGSFTCYAKGDGTVIVDDVFYPLGEEIAFAKGEHTLSVKIGNPGGLPCIFADGDVSSDESWTVTHGGAAPVSAGATPAFTAKENDPQVFPFAYTRMDAVEVRPQGEGLLFDFGRELFGKVVLEELSAPATVYYGESVEEALAGKGWGKCTLWEDVAEAGVLRARAFRYLYVTEPCRLHAEFEYLPIEKRGSFSCNEENIKTIWDVCAETFHLCSREFFLDGIKRDRWVWSGDARQSILISDYLFADPELVKRTILALLPKDRVHQHVNTINDYSAFLIISVAEYYLSFGDTEFVNFILPRVRMLYDYVAHRLEDEFVVEREGDWIFIDWGTIEKNGPVSAEQILLWKCHLAMASLTGEKAYRTRAEALREKIMDTFWTENGFTDNPTTSHVTRQANILAVLFDFVDEGQARVILERVLENPAVDAITTPYFKFYELMALCRLGRLSDAQETLANYWGAMLSLGATSMWEEFKPEEGLPAGYAMYGEEFGKSLCHAWSSGPICFLGRYCLGVYPTAKGYETFRVEPNPGRYTSFEGVVPTVRGDIRVVYDGGITVLAPFDGGTLLWQGKEYSIPAGKEFTVSEEL